MVIDRSNHVTIISNLEKALEDVERATSFHREVIKGSSDMSYMVSGRVLGMLVCHLEVTLHHHILIIDITTLARKSA